MLSATANAIQQFEMCVMTEVLCVHSNCATRAVMDISLFGYYGLHRLGTRYLVIISYSKHINIQLSNYPTEYLLNYQLISSSLLFEDLSGKLIVSKLVTNLISKLFSNLQSCD
jgi:hypothetical protein